jgi:tetratricopeptide (TPR) repeat protein
MNEAAFGMSVTSLILAAVAYWRSGGRRDAERVQSELNRDIETLRVKYEESIQSLEEAIATAYENSRQRLKAAREKLHQLSDAAVEGLEKQVQLARQQLEALARRVEEAAKSAGKATVAAARKIEEGLAIRVRRIEARALLLNAKAQARLAIGLAAAKTFDRAEEFLEDATDLLRSAREILGDDHAYDQPMDKMRASLREATAAVRSHAANVHQKVEQVITDTDRIVSSLEADETKEAAEVA